jgi:hypothetical protein
MSYSTQGSSNRVKYDCCAYSQSLEQSVKPLDFQLYFGSVENENSCIDKKKWYKQDTEIVDVESQLWKLTQPMSKCDKFKYNPSCQKNELCMSTYDESAPRVLSPSLCPILHNNIPKQTHVGYTLPDPKLCMNEHFTEVGQNNPAKMSNDRYMEILGNKYNEYKFLNGCNNKPLYEGSMQEVRGFFDNSHRAVDLKDSMYSGGMATNAWGDHDNDSMASF